MSLTQEQILKLAPDDAAAKAGQQLAVPAKWEKISENELALWGDCQGSGANPYKTMVDLKNLAFKCSCPSRKFPCKHGLGLLLLYATHPGNFVREEKLPEIVQEWLLKREEKTVVKEGKENKPVDVAAQQKRADARVRKVKSGIDELRTWLRDVVRTGISNVPQNPYQFSANITARMVDSQAGGLAAQLRQINKINFYTEGWQKNLARRLSKIYLITEAYKNESLFDEPLRQEIAALIGWTTPKEEVLSGETIQDQWLILSKTSETENSLTTERVWFFGLTHKKFALIFNFFAPGQLSQQSFTPGTILHAEMAFYPAIIPQRVLIKSQNELDLNFRPVEGSNEIDFLFENNSEQRALNPFPDSTPALLSGMKIILQHKTWYLKDGLQKAIVLSNAEDECWRILSVSKGREFSCFGLYENGTLDLYSVWIKHNFYLIK